MSKFKVGDKVKILSVDSSHAFEGKVGTIIEIDTPRSFFPYHVRIKNGRYPRNVWFYKHELEKLDE